MIEYSANWVGRDEKIMFHFSSSRNLPEKFMPKSTYFMSKVNFRKLYNEEK